MVGVLTGIESEAQLKVMCLYGFIVLTFIFFISVVIVVLRDNFICQLSSYLASGLFYQVTKYCINPFSQSLLYLKFTKFVIPAEEKYALWIFLFRR